MHLDTVFLARARSSSLMVDWKKTKILLKTLLLSTSLKLSKMMKFHQTFNYCTCQSTFCIFSSNLLVREKKNYTNILLLLVTIPLKAPLLLSFNSIRLHALYNSLREHSALRRSPKSVFSLFMKIVFSPKLKIQTKGGTTI